MKWANLLFYSRYQNYSSIWDNTCDFSLVWLLILIIFHRTALGTSFLTLITSSAADCIWRTRRISGRVIPSPRKTKIIMVCSMSTIKDDSYIISNSAMFSHCKFYHTQPTIKFCDTTCALNTRILTLLNIYMHATFLHVEKIVIKSIILFFSTLFFF